MASWGCNHCGAILDLTSPDAKRHQERNCLDRDALIRQVCIDLALVQQIFIGGECAFCELDFHKLVAGRASADFEVTPSDHDADCIWRRAVELFPDEPGAS